VQSKERKKKAVVKNGSLSMKEKNAAEGGEEASHLGRGGKVSQGDVASQEPAAEKIRDSGRFKKHPVTSWEKESTKKSCRKESKFRERGQPLLLVKGALRR